MQELNLLKGNINMTNEMLDNCKSRQYLQENQIVIDFVCIGEINKFVYMRQLLFYIDYIFIQKCYIFGNCQVIREIQINTF